MRLKTNLKIREIAGEKIILIHSKGEMDMTKAVSMNKTAEWLWLSLNEKEFTTSDVEECITQRYGIDKEQAHKDAVNWIESMIQAGLMEK